MCTFTAFYQAAHLPVKEKEKYRPIALQCICPVLDSKLATIASGALWILNVRLLGPQIKFLVQRVQHEREIFLAILLVTAEKLLIAMTQVVFKRQRLNRMLPSIPHWGHQICKRRCKQPLVAHRSVQVYLREVLFLVHEVSHNRPQIRDHLNRTIHVASVT